MLVIHFFVEKLSNERRTSLRRIVLLGAVFALMFFVLKNNPVLAQTATDSLQSIGETVGFSQDSLPVLIAKIIRAALGVLGLILVVLILYAGFLYMTAAGDDTKVDKAKKIITQAVIGFIIVMSAFSITQFILNGLLGGTFGGSNVSENRVRGIARFSEPRSGSLGAGIIEDHYPGRNALEVPRNVSIFVTFKEPINPASFIVGYDATLSPEAQSTQLNTDNVKIFATADSEQRSLTGDQVRVQIDAEKRTVIFDPVDLLGNPSTDTNYTVSLNPTIELANGDAAFSGRFNDGYLWTFEVSTKVDLTPPNVVSMQPASNQTHARNMAVQVTFNEAMFPLSVSGILGNGDNENFSNIEVLSGQSTVQGKYSLSNNYRTVTFVTNDACAQDACGEVVYCLPGGEQIQVTVHSATVSSTPPQAVLASGRFDGAVDAANNSLDGNRNFSTTRPAETAEGRPVDDVSWSFSTNNQIDSRTPSISTLIPELDAEYVNPDQEVEVTFSMPMLSSSMTTRNIQLFPDIWYEFPSWLTSEDVTNEAGNVETSKALIHHRTLIPPDVEGGMIYWPLVSNEVKGINQFCMYPSDGPEAVNVGNESCGTTALPYCCNGRASETACETSSDVLPYEL